jgi:hypothetical protein
VIWLFREGIVMDRPGVPGISCIGGRKCPIGEYSQRIVAAASLPRRVQVVQGHELDSAIKRRPPPWGKAAAGGRMLSDRGTDVFTDGFGRGGKSLPRPRPGGWVEWPVIFFGVGPRLGVVYLGGRFTVAARHRSASCWGKLAADERILKQRACQFVFFEIAPVVEMPQIALSKHFNRE